NQSHGCFESDLHTASCALRAEWGFAVVDCERLSGSGDVHSVQNLPVEESFASEFGSAHRSGLGSVQGSQNGRARGVRNLSFRFASPGLLVRRFLCIPLAYPDAAERTRIPNASSNSCQQLD